MKMRKISTSEILMLRTEAMMPVYLDFLNQNRIGHIHRKQFFAKMMPSWNEKKENVTGKVQFPHVGVMCWPNESYLFPLKEIKFSIKKWMKSGNGRKRNDSKRENRRGKMKALKKLS